MTPPSGSGHGRDVLDRYFALSDAIEEAKRDRDFRKVIQSARETYALLPAFVGACKPEYGRFDIHMSHAVHTAPTIMAVMGDVEGIRELRKVLENVAELREWLPAAILAEEDLALVPRIVAAVKGEPGLKQSLLKARLDLHDGKRASQLVAWLEKAGRIVRVRKGSTYLLYQAGQPIPTANSLRAGSPPKTSPSD